jgi:hypothetical protein
MADWWNLRWYWQTSAAHAGRLFPWGLFFSLFIILSLSVAS